MTARVLRTRKSRPASVRKSRGVAMVEFMIVLPVILLITFGVTELGRAIIQYNTLTKALEGGARHAAAYGLLGTAGSVFIDPTLDAEIRNLVVYGDTPGSGTPVLQGFDPAQISITETAPGWIEISAVYPYVPALGNTLPTFGFGPPQSVSFNMAAAVTMRAL